jgi:hypothetical protein
MEDEAMTREALSEMAAQEMLPRDDDDDETSGDEQTESEPEPDVDEGADLGEEAPPEPATDMDMEERFKRLDSESKRHLTRVQTIMGENFEGAEPCPMCISPGVVFPFNPDDEGDAERRAIVLDYFALGIGNLQTARDAVECPDCDGLGQVLTGSKRASWEVKDCSTCGGKGWVEPTVLQARTDAGSATMATPPGIPPPSPGFAEGELVTVRPDHPMYATIKALAGNS